MNTAIKILQGLTGTISGLILLYVLGAAYKYGLPVIFVSTKMFIVVVGGTFASFMMLAFLQASHDKQKRAELLDIKQELYAQKLEK